MGRTKQPTVELTRPYERQPPPHSPLSPTERLSFGSFHRHNQTRNRKSLPYPFLFRRRHERQKPCFKKQSRSLRWIRLEESSHRPIPQVEVQPAQVLRH